MALGPKDMGEAIIRNLKEKTGKDLDEWLKVVRASGLTVKKDVISYLKTKHSVGHFQAQKIFERFSGTDEYDNPDGFSNALFTDPRSMNLYQCVKQKLLLIGTDVKEQPCKTYIPFYRKTQFAVIYPAKNGSINVGLNLPESNNPETFKRKSSKAGDRINFEANIHSVDEIDVNFLNTCNLAYQIN